MYKTVRYAQTIDFHCFVHCVSSNTRKHATPRILHCLPWSTRELFKFLPRKIYSLTSNWPV